MDERIIEKRIVYFFRFLLFFCMNAFVITCCFVLFLHNLELTSEQVSNNAKLTFFNVMIISLIFLVIDSIRKKWLVDKPIKKINDGLDKIMKGEFETKIEKLSPIENANQFNSIINQINKMSSDLESVETLRTDFISNVSHELKTPLAIIGNYGTLLQSENLEEEQRIEYAKAITNTTRRLADLITNILKLNKLDNQQIYPDIKEYNLSEQLCECLLQFEDMWEEKNIEIDTDIQEDVFIHADGELLSLVWNNLISNALKFTDIHGMIYVGLKMTENEVIVIVKDTGCGMSAETGKHIFDKFYQGDTSHTTQGNGLGLALVKKVIDIVNGEIFVQSEVGKGSQFEIRLKKEKD